MNGMFYVAANAIIFRKDGKILILKRKPNYDQSPDKWDTVSGRLHQHIKNVQSELKRELIEELGEDFICEIVSPISTYNFYRGGDKTQELVGIDYYCKYISGEVILSEEHTAYKWIDPKDFIKYDISESLKNAVEQAIKVFNCDILKC